jgi:hypothetical protein
VYEERINGMLGGGGKKKQKVINISLFANQTRLLSGYHLLQSHLNFNHFNHKDLQASTKMLTKLAMTAGLLLAGAQAQQLANCEYQSLKCGSVLLAAPFGKLHSS